MMSRMSVPVATAERDATKPRRTAAETLSALDSSVAVGLRSEEAKARLEREGANEVPEARPQPFARIARKFWGVSAWMIELIALLSLVLQKWADFWIALALLLVNAVLSFIQEGRSAAAVSALRLRLRVTARVLRDGAWHAIPARELVVGDIVRVRTGDFVPADAQILEGVLQVDQSALTGESQELTKGRDQVIYSGSVARRGEVTAVIVATGVRSYMGRTTELVQSAQPKLHVDEVVARVVRWLFAIVGTLVGTTLVVSFVEGLPASDILPLSLVLLMSAVPVALPVMFTVSMALGSAELARHGVLVTRLSAAEDAASMDVVCADKTGTLTMNRVSFGGAVPQPGETEESVARDGALASTEANQDAIDAAFLHAARERGLLEPATRTVAFTPFSPETRRTEALVERDGRRVRVMKGALRTVAEATGLDADGVRALEAHATEAAQRGFRALAVARAEADQPWRLVGLALLHDAPRADSRRLIAKLRSLGVSVKMLTGDAFAVATEIARELGVGEMRHAGELRAARGSSADAAARLVEQSDGFAEVFPEDKFVVVESLQKLGHVAGMTGDGVNDAPALKQAEVGIAVSGATDVAKGAASVVLTSDGLEGIIDLVENGRAIYQRVLTWIVNKVSRTILKAGFVVLAFLATGKFVISALGMILLVFMTDFVKIALSTDRVFPSRSPESWNIGPLVTLAVALGLVMLAETLVVLAIGWRAFGLGTDPGRLQTFTFQVLLFFALFSIVSIRERRAFWASRPSAILAGALCADAAVGVLIGLFGLAELRPLPPRETGVIVASAIVCTLGVNDLLKRVYISRYWSGAALSSAVRS
jgi:H+-transporting ATPase